MTTHTELRQRARAILAGTECVSPASVYDAVSARVASMVGFKLGLFSGSMASAATLPAPDLAVVTLTEFANSIRSIVRAGDLTLLVDADHGYGNALNVMRCVEETEHAGVSILGLEDLAQPQAFGSSRLEPVSIPEMVGTRGLFGATGYRTYMAGKWHIGTDPLEIPRARGFAEAWRLKGPVVRLAPGRGHAPHVVRPADAGVVEALVGEVRPDVAHRAAGFAAEQAQAQALRRGQRIARALQVAIVR